MNQADHDLLIEIRQDVKNFSKIFDEHIKSDKESFEENDKRLGAIEKSWWKACGALSVVLIVLDVALKVLLK